GAALETPERPLAGIVGGAKVSTKLDLLAFMLDKVDVLVIGGAMANTLLFAMGKEVGKSLCEKELVDTAKGILDKAAKAGRTLVVARRVAELTQAGELLSVGGGGDTVAALGAAGVADKLSYVSTAGGAFLEWLEGKELPGVAALDR